jgi:soluble lytic murein transglycosylase-like protein
METKFNRIILQNVLFKALSSTGLAFFLIITSGISNIPIVQAEPFIRISQKGVIYYYFSDRENNNSKYLPNKVSRLVPTNHPQRKKISDQELESWINGAGQQHNLPPALIKAVIQVESNFNPDATSPKGAQGLMQLMPGTADQLQVTNPYDIKENIWAGTRYLGMLLQKFNNNLPMALAAYNAGPHRVQQYRAIPPIKETQGFVRDVCTEFLQYGREPTPSR